MESPDASLPCVAFSPLGNLFAVGCKGEILFFQVKDEKGAKPPADPAVKPPAANRKELAVFDVVPLSSISHDISADGKHIYLGAVDAERKWNIRKIDVATKQQTVLLKFAADAVRIKATSVSSAWPFRRPATALPPAAATRSRSSSWAKPNRPITPNSQAANARSVR